MLAQQNAAKLDYNKGIIFYEKGQYGLSIEHFKAAITKDPTNFQFYYNLGLAYIKTEKNNLAIENFNKAINLNPKDADSYYSLGNAYFNDNKTEASIKAYKQAVQLAPGDFNNYESLGIAYFTLKNYDDAILNFEKSVEIESKNPSTVYNLAYTYYLKEQFELAEKYFLQVISLTPDDDEAYLNVGNIYLKQKKYNDSKEYFELAISKNPNNEGAQEALASLNQILESGEVHQEQIIETSIQSENILKPDLTEPVPAKIETTVVPEPVNVANIGAENCYKKTLQYLATKDIELAFDEITKALSFNQDYPNAQALHDEISNTIKEINGYFNKGVSFYAMNDYQSSIENFEKALNLSPNNQKVQTKLAEAIQMNIDSYKAYMEFGDYEVFEKEIKRLIADHPEQPELHFNLGNVLIKQKDYNQAFDSLKTTLEIDPNHKEAQEVFYDLVKVLNTDQDQDKDNYQLALLYFQKKDYNNAVVALGKVLEHKPNDQDAQKLLDKVMVLMNKTDNHNADVSNENLSKELAAYSQKTLSNPNDYDSFYKIGIIYEKKQRFDLALENYSKALSLKPDFKEVQQAIFELTRTLNS